MVLLGTRVEEFEIACPRCFDPIACEVQIGPGFSVGTAKDGTAQLHVAVKSTPKPHTCRTIREPR